MEQNIIIRTSIKKACAIYLDREGDFEEMDIDYSIIEEKVKELNEMGINITLKEIGEIIESKFRGYKCDADLRRWPTGDRIGKLINPRYTMIKPKINQIEVNQKLFDKAYEKVKDKPFYSKAKVFFEIKLSKEAKKSKGEKNNFRK